MSASDKACGFPTHGSDNETGFVEGNTVSLRHYEDENGHRHFYSVRAL